MTPAEFKRSLSKTKPPSGLSLAVTGLWWAGKNDWNKAHKIVMDDDGNRRRAAAFRRWMILFLFGWNGGRRRGRCHIIQADRGYGLAALARQRLGMFALQETNQLFTQFGGRVRRFARRV